MPLTMPLKKKSKEAADVKIYNHDDARSTAMLATKIDIALEPEMIAGAKRSLAECLGTDELHSEALYDNMNTGNDEGLGLAWETTKIPALETKVKGFARQLKGMDKEMTGMRKEMKNLHNSFNQLGQQTDVKLCLCYTDIRNRFLSTFQRDLMGNESRENQKIINQGNLAAQYGSFMVYEGRYAIRSRGLDGRIWPAISTTH